MSCRHTEGVGAALLSAEPRPHFQFVPFFPENPVFTPGSTPGPQGSAPPQSTAPSSHGGSQWEGEPALPETFSRLFPFYINLINVNMSLKTRALFINHLHFR